MWHAGMQARMQAHRASSASACSVRLGILKHTHAWEGGKQCHISMWPAGKCSASAGNGPLHIMLAWVLHLFVKALCSSPVPPLVAPMSLCCPCHKSLQDVGAQDAHVCWHPPFF